MFFFEISVLYMSFVDTVDWDHAKLSVGASFLAYAEERLPEKLPKWAQLLEDSFRGGDIE